MKSALIHFGVLGILLAVSVSLHAHQPAPKGKPSHFLYDPADRTITATMLEGNEFYDPGVLAGEDGLWITWLEFVPEQGDHLWVGRREGDGWAVKERVPVEPQKIARPTLTRDAGGRTWLTYEALNPDGRQWDVFIIRRRGDGQYTQPERISPGAAGDINHRVAADPRDGLWVVWQSDRRGQFDVMARRVGTASSTEPHAVSDSPRGDWHPAVAVTPKGEVCIVWDSYDGDSFNVLARRLVDDRLGPVTAVAATLAFEGRAQVACDRRGRTWILWEEDGPNWGKPYRGKLEGAEAYGRRTVFSNATDTHGPLHRFRKLHVAMLEPDGAIRQLADPVPMPSLGKARNRKGRWEGARDLGMYYERGLLAVDQSGRLWVVYRHYYMPLLGVQIPIIHHIEEGWQLFARCLEADGWSKLYAFNVLQRDAMQRLSIAPCATGLAAVWTTGRTDRRKDPKPRGVAVALLNHPAGAASQPKFLKAQSRAEVPVSAELPEAPRPAKVAEKTHHLVYGDLHRHTDLSLCRVYWDGSIDDAYRYAIDVARLDFLGITDHTRDINHGNALSQLWWRCTKEVTRHRLAGRFMPYFTYERSHGETDHNVISLRDDMIRNFPPPLTEFWKELGRDTFTIPHAPINTRTWAYQNDALRPLLEIYQGCRNYDSRAVAHVGLDKGYHLGFIASSDHLSTSASYACVWTPEVSRESVFRSMQARRTFGATDKIRLVFRSGDHWMGQRFNAAELPEFQIEIDGTAPLAHVEICDNGEPAGQIPVPDGATSLRTTYRPGRSFSGKHYVYVWLVQTDGNQAWSSPIWINYDNPALPAKKTQ